MGMRRRGAADPISRTRFAHLIGRRHGLLQLRDAHADTLQAPDRIIQQTRDDERHVRVHGRVIVVRIQQYVIQTSDHGMDLHELGALVLDQLGQRGCIRHEILRGGVGLESMGGAYAGASCLYI